MAHAARLPLPQGRRSRRLVVNGAEAALWAIAIVCLGYVATVLAARKVTEVRLSAQLAALRAEPGAIVDRALPPFEEGAPAPAAVPVRREAPGRTEGDLVGRVILPRLGIDAIVMEGTTPRILDVAVGHMSQSPLPGSPGRVVLTAHRDSFFRPLRDIASGDEVRIQTGTRDLRYEVVSTEIVSPKDLGVLRATAERELALVTCFPFHYIGAAPMRFIVHAREIRGDATAQRPISEGAKTIR